MSNQINTGKFTVAIGNSVRASDRSPSPDQTCGHIHRTQAAAEKCQHKLLAWDKERKNCSAKWYNSRILMCGCDTDSGYL